MRRLAAACAFLAISCAMPAPAYYYFVHYLGGANAIEKFDLTVLPNQTVTFFVSENGPTAYSQTDTFNSVLGQIKQATAVWNGVSSSALRVAFGGLENGATLQNTPGGDVLFEDLPPGVEGFGGPTTLANPVTTASGSQFYPIVRSALYLNQNMTLAPGPSFNQSFFMTTVHEIGHALGLQHTFTSSTMSQATTRATTVTHPLDTDDIAAISSLYPNANFAQFGSITGRITAGGNGVHLASVVAIQSGAGAVSAVTNPDGSFEIDGIPPGNYFVYVHTMPPDANIIGPWNADGSQAMASSPVSSLFYVQGSQATTNLNAASTVAVSAGQITPGINISTTTLASVPFYDGQIYGFLNGTIPITPAPVNMSALPPIAASVVGLGSNGQIPGLSVTVIGGSLSFNTQPYQANGYTYAALYPTVNAGALPGSQHVIFTTPNYMYVLPSGINLTQNNPPAIASVTPNSDGTLTVAGSSWAPGTQIYFDSLPASILSLDPNADVSILIPPAGANNQQATLTAYNIDGQNSQFLQSSSPVLYSYGSAAPPQITGISPSSLPAGAEAMIDITAAGVNFQQGITTVGFGTTDVLVRRVFVLSSTHLQVDVSVSTSAALTNTDLSIVTGFQLATATGVFQITALNAGLPNVVPILVNAVPGMTGSYAGAIVSLYGTNLVTPNVPPVISIGGQTASVIYASATQINLIIPSGLPPGPAILQFSNGLIGNAYPVVVNIDTPPAGIAAIQNSTGAYIYSAQAAHPGDTLIVTLVNFAPAGSNISPGQVQVSVGGVIYTPSQIVSIDSVWQVIFTLDSRVPIGPFEPLIAYLNGRSSLPANIPVSN